MFLGYGSVRKRQEYNHPSGQTCNPKKELGWCMLWMTMHTTDILPEQALKKSGNDSVQNVTTCKAILRLKFIWQKHGHLLKLDFLTLLFEKGHLSRVLVLKWDIFCWMSFLKEVLPKLECMLIRTEQHSKTAIDEG